MISEISSDIGDILALCPVVPVLVIDDAGGSVPLVRALIDGGLRVLEVTLRTPEALAAITAIAEEVEDAVVGAGTVTSVSQLAAAKAAGAAFAVSPGYAPDMVEAASDLALPYLPAVSSASEVMAAQRQGLRFLKFFPAEASGGVSMLRALQGPFPELEFCPTGGISEDTFKSYLRLANVRCVGGGWIAPRDRVAARDWPAIEFAARRIAGPMPTKRTV